MYRRAYWGYADHFKEEADKLLNSLDASYRRMLQGEMGGSMSNSNSSQSLHHAAASSSTKPGIVQATVGPLDAVLTA